MCGNRGDSWRCAAPSGPRGEDGASEAAGGGGVLQAAGPRVQPPGAEHGSRPPAAAGEGGRAVAGRGGVVCHRATSRSSNFIPAVEENDSEGPG